MSFHLFRSLIKFCIRLDLSPGPSWSFRNQGGWYQSSLAETQAGGLEGGDRSAAWAPGFVLLGPGCALGGDQP